MGGKVGLICGSCWSGKYTSGSGSVIGRDPLPPRAVSTSTLPQKQNQQQNQQQKTSSQSQQQQKLSSTLPYIKANHNNNHNSTGNYINVGNHQSRQNYQQIPVNRQPSPQKLPIGHRDYEDDYYNTQILKAASSGDVRLSSTMLNDYRDPRIASPCSAQRLMSPTNHLRVISPIDHRVSSPSDSERIAHSQSDRELVSPIGRVESDYGTNLRQIQRNPMTRQSTEVLNNRNQANPRRLVRSTGTGNLVKVSAGELLGRTHEELVLLLIQLRRQSATLCKAMETCHMEIEAQARLVELDTPRRLENLQKLEELKKHLMDLEKQYEKGKPLVNLVDNMVKLGSLYNCNNGKTNGLSSSASESRYNIFPSSDTNSIRDPRLEFNQRVQEQRLLAEERRDWDRLSPDHGQLQAKVQQLYKLDQLLQEESGTLHSLQQNKELLEKALGGLRNKMQVSRSNPAEVERYKEQQLLLERELSRVRLLLAHNSKKLEETVAENARLEQDLVVLRQKLQQSRRYTGNVPTIRDSSGTTATLEKELRRVQQLVGDLQRQRQELSIQVRQLTEKSHSLVQQIRPQNSSTAQVHQSKKRPPNSWHETDLDSGITREHSIENSSRMVNGISPSSPHQNHHHHHQSHHQQPHYKEVITTPTTHNMAGFSQQMREQIHQHQLKQQLLKDQMQGKGSPVNNMAPLYANIEPRRLENHQSVKNYEHVNGGHILPPEYIPPPPPPPPNEDGLMNGYHEEDKYGVVNMNNREKQEIKTVRIVKRESERRSRDRCDRTNGSLQAPGGARRLGDDEYGGSQQFEVLDRVIEETPIIHAQSTGQLAEIDENQFQRSMSLPRGFGGQNKPSQPAQSQGPVPPPPRSDSMNAIKNMMTRRHNGGHHQRIRVGMGRARDDLDMERALRPRINAPDVVRSTLSHKELKYNESTIDSLLGTPSKIFIPERYIPEKTPELTDEERERRLKKAESIRKMLSETTVTTGDGTEDENNVEMSEAFKKKVAEEKKEREHILQLKQILAKQVMEKSKMVAVKALATLPLNGEPSLLEDDDSSPVNPLPLYQQRDNFYS